MAISETEFVRLKNDVKKLEADLKRVNDLLFGIADDKRFKNKIRAQVFDGEHTANKPIAVNKNGKRYNLETV